MYDHLRRGSAALSREAAGAHETPFWSARADDEPDATERRVGRRRAARGCPRPRARSRSSSDVQSIHLRPSDALEVVQRAIVRGHRVVLEEHLAAPAAPHGVRYCRNVDLVLLARLAPQFDQVPDLYDAYNRAAPPAPLPDFLGALSTLVGLGMLTSRR